MRLTGVSRVLTQEVGFDNTFADVEYFTYDPTGAYAPLEPVFGGDVTGIEGTNSDAGVYGTVIDNWLTLNNVPESAKIEIYSSIRNFEPLQYGHCSSNNRWHYPSPTFHHLLKKKGCKSH